MVRNRYIVAGALLLTVASPAWAQDDPKPEEERPPKDEPKTSVVVEHPEEIKRIQDELARIQRERVRLAGKKITVRDAPAPSGKKMSPILSPRTTVWGVRLEDAIAQALENNPDYLLVLLDARSAHELPAQSRALFDPALSFSTTWRESRPAFFSNNPFTGLPAGLSVASSRALDVTTTFSQLLPTGTQLSLSWVESRIKTENQFSLNPSYAPRLVFSVTQPLLKGFGVDVNLANLRNARSTAAQSDATLAETYMGAVVAVEQAYWELIRAEENLKSQERSLSSSLQFLADQRKREEHGAGTKLDVTIAKAGVASRREAVIVAENSLEASRDQIVRLCRPASDPKKWDLFVVPIDQPLAIKEPPLDPVASIQMALQRRPDYYRSLLELDKARRSLVAAENNALPSLNLTGSWSQEGLGSQHNSAWTAVSRGRFYTWSLGVSVDLPLFLRSEQAQVRQARLAIERAETDLKRIEANVVLDIRRAIRNLRTAKARIEASRASRVLAEERLKATREMLKAGTAVPRDVLDDLAQLAAAESAEVQAFINYRLSISRLKQAQGTLLDPWLDKLDPRVRRVLDRQPEQ